MVSNLEDFEHASNKTTLFSKTCHSVGLCVSRMDSMGANVTMQKNQ